MSGGSAPANTTSTTTVNQSPWQNATYRALALGTPGNLGPVAQQLKIGQQLTQDWQNIQSGRDPGAYYGLTNATPERVAQEAAMREQQRIDEARKRFGGEKFILNDAQGKAVEVRAEHMDEFLKNKKAQEYVQNWNKAFEESQAPFEMATSLAAMGSMAAPVIQSMMENKTPITPRTAAALGALGSLVQIGRAHV